MRYQYLFLALFVLLAACGGPAETPAPAASQDSIVNTAAVDSLTPEQLAAMATKADGYYARERVEDLPETLTKFVPAGYQIMDTCQGDLNLDAYADYLLLLNRPGEDTLGKSAVAVDGYVKRKLLVLTGQPDNTYQLAASSDNAVYCSQCGGGGMGDPYAALVIRKGYFSVEHYGGGVRRWTRTTTFQYSPANTTWLLHKDGHGEFDAVPEEGKGENKTEKIYTIKDFGKVLFGSFDIYKD